MKIYKAQGVTKRKLVRKSIEINFWEEKIMDNQFKDEELTPEELDNVAGGTLAEMRRDAAFLQTIGLDIKPHSIQYTHENFEAVADELRGAWLKVGVFCKTISTDANLENVYTDLSGNVITRKQAMQMALKAQGLK